MGAAWRNEHVADSPRDVPTAKHRLADGRHDGGALLSRQRRSGHRSAERDDRPAQQNWDIADIERHADAAGPSVDRRLFVDRHASCRPPTRPATAWHAIRKASPTMFRWSCSTSALLPTMPNRVIQYRVAGRLHERDASNERAVKAKVVSTGLNGGELLFDRLRCDQRLHGQPSPFDES